MVLQGACCCLDIRGMRRDHLFHGSVRQQEYVDVIRLQRNAGLIGEYEESWVLNRSIDNRKDPSSVRLRRLLNFLHSDSPSMVLDRIANSRDLDIFIKL